MGTTVSPTSDDVPRRVRNEDIAHRYGISERLAAEWRRQMIADGAAARVRSIIVARPSAMDAWVAAGGQRRGRR